MPSHGLRKIDTRWAAEPRSCAAPYLASFAAILLSTIGVPYEYDDVRRIVELTSVTAAWYNGRARRELTLDGIELAQNGVRTHFSQPRGCEMPQSSKAVQRCFVRLKGSTGTWRVSVVRIERFRAEGHF